MSVAEEFTPIPLKYDDDDQYFHQLYVKANVSRISNKVKPNGRTVLALNVPPYATTKSLRNAFSKAGPVANVIVQETPNSSDKSSKADPSIVSKAEINKFKVAYVIFEKESSLRKLLRTRKLLPLNSDKSLLTGLDKWVQAYQKRIADPSTMQQDIDNYMANFDRETEEKKQQAEEEDDEGWIKPTTASANVFSQRESVVKKLQNKLSMDKKRKELQYFYSFQIREAKRNDIISLRKKYDRDQHKMEQIKKNKRFKPY